MHFATTCVCVLCVRDDKVEPLDPHADSKVGEKVFVEGYQHDVAGGILHYMYILLQHRV